MLPAEGLLCLCYESSYSSFEVCVEISWQFLIIHHLWNAPRCHLVVLVAWEMVKAFSSTITSDDSQGSCPEPQRNPQIPNTSRSSAMQRHFIQGQQTPYFNWTQQIRCRRTRSVWQLFIRYFTWFYVSKICDVGAFTAVLLTPCHWARIAGVSKQCITVILTSQVDGVEFFTPSFSILFETSLSTPATTQQNLREYSLKWYIILHRV